MKAKLFYLFFCIFAFIRSAEAQNFANNLKSYQSINYHIYQLEEVNPLLVLSFTESNLNDKLQNFFYVNNIHATHVTTLKYPCLKVIVQKAIWANISDYPHYYDAYSYQITFNLWDMIGDKPVIVYSIGDARNTINAGDAEKANKLWDIVNTCMNQFAHDWKATH